jgi:hypothetical protein
MNFWNKVSLRLAAEEEEMVVKDHHKLIITKTDIFPSSILLWIQALAIHRRGEVREASHRIKWTKESIKRMNNRTESIGLRTVCNLLKKLLQELYGQGCSQPLFTLLAKGKIRQWENRHTSIPTPKITSSSSVSRLKDKLLPPQFTPSLPLPLIERIKEEATLMRQRARWMISPLTLKAHHLQNRAHRAQE